MAYRVTEKDLSALLEILNADQGKYKLDFAYGGVRLVQRTNEHGAIRVISCDGYGTKKQLYTYMRGLIDGMAFQKEVQS